jgi:hypothetical protein
VQALLLSLRKSHETKSRQSQTDKSANLHVSLPRLLNDCGELPMNKTTPQIKKFMLKSPARNDAQVDPNDCSRA